jgi:hypothetical protein
MNHSSNDEQAIAAELAALGEAPLSVDELRIVRDDGASPDVDACNVAALFGIAHPPAEATAELDELQRRRVWKVVAERGDLDLDGGPRELSLGSTWRVVVGAVAVAAGVLLVPRLAPPTDLPSEAALAAQREDLQAAGETARAAVDALPGPVAGERARAMADAYAQRLAERQGVVR